MVGLKQKYFIKRIEQGEDCRIAFIGYKNYRNYKRYCNFISFSLGRFYFKIRFH